MDLRGQALYDTRAFPDAPLSGKITTCMTGPRSRPQDDGERAAVEQMRAMVKRIKKRKGKSQ